MYMFIVKNSTFSNIIKFLHILVFGLSLTLISCSSISINKYQSPELNAYKVSKIAVMPIVITSGTQTKVSGSYSPSWISETHTTRALSPSEYYPAEQEFVRILSNKLTSITLIKPDQVDREMKNVVIKTYNKAIIAAAKHFDADAVIALRIRDLNLRAGSYFEGRPAASGHVDLTLYSKTGDALWSVSASVMYREGTVASPAPSMASFIGYVVSEFENELAELNKRF